MIILAFNSCGFNNKNYDDFSKLERQDVTKETSKDIEIIGEWGIYHHIINGIIASCNVCPRIRFNDSQTAVLTLPSGEKEKYTWSILEKSLKLGFVQDDDLKHYLPSSTYEMEFIKQDGYDELFLFLNKEEKFVLRK